MALHFGKEPGRFFPRRPSTRLVRLLWVVGAGLWTLPVYRLLAEPSAASSPPLVLESTLLQAEGRLAVINGTVVQEGQTLSRNSGRFRIERIQPRRVFLSASASAGRQMIELTFPRTKTTPQQTPGSSIQIDESG